MSHVRWVAVDDTDSGINYSSGWAQDDGNNWNNRGNFGQTFMNSLHSVTAGSASFTYTFDGSNGKVFGTTNVRTSGGVQDPVWRCEVDGTTIPLSKPFPYVENNAVLCRWSNIAAGRHTLKVTVTSSTQVFLFDQFQYVPSPSADIKDANIMISCTDAAINYGSGWKDLGGDLARMALAGGAVMSFPFYGTGITWFGYIPIELPHGSTTAEYSIDGGSSTTFTVPGSFGGTSQFFQLVFQVGGLSLGSHTLRVTSKGQTSLTPLVLTNLVVQNGVTQEPSPPDSGSGSGISTTNAANAMTVITTLPGGQVSTAIIPASHSATPSNVGSSNGISHSSSGSVSSATGLPGTSNAGSGSSSADVPGASKSGPPIGGIVGGILGGLLVILLFSFLYYRRQKRLREVNEAGQVQPFSRDVPPSWVVYSGFRGPPETSGPHQTTEMGNIQGSFARKAAMAATSPHTRYISTAPGFSSDPINFQSNPYADAESVRGSIHLGTGSEASATSSTGSGIPLLRLNRNREENLAESSQSHSSRRVVTHEDSGFRMQQTQENGVPLLPTEVVEYPPVYTPV